MLKGFMLLMRMMKIRIKVNYVANQDISLEFKKLNILHHPSYIGYLKRPPGLYAQLWLLEGAKGLPRSHETLQKV